MCIRDSQCGEDSLSDLKDEHKKDVPHLEDIVGGGATEKDKWYNALIQGDELRSSYFDIYMEFGYNSDFKLTAVTIGTQDSTGHKTSK